MFNTMNNTTLKLHANNAEKSMQCILNEYNKGIISPVISNEFKEELESAITSLKKYQATLGLMDKNQKKEPEVIKIEATNFYGEDLFEEFEFTVV